MDKKQLTTVFLGIAMPDYPLQWALYALQCIGFIALETLQTLGMLGMNKISHSLCS